MLCCCIYLLLFSEPRHHMRARGQHNKAVTLFLWNICAQAGWRKGEESLSLFTFCSYIHLFVHQFYESSHGVINHEKATHTCPYGVQNHTFPSGTLTRSGKNFTQHNKMYCFLVYTRKCRRFSNKTSEDYIEAFILIHHSLKSQAVQAQVRLEWLPWS